MSILIRGVEMPERCFECPLIDATDGFWCSAADKDLRKEHGINLSKPDWCPLRHIPDDTAFIDAKALVKSFVPKQAYFTEAIIEKFWNHELVLRGDKL